MPQLRTKSFYKTIDDNNIVIIRFTHAAKDVRKYSVQYQAWINEKWYTVRRYDNSHGSQHYHVYSLRSKPVIRQEAEREVAVAMNESIAHCVSHWRAMRQEYIL